MSTSLDISGKIDEATVEVFRAVSRAAESMGIAYVVVGATARDLVLHHAHGAALERATRDVDFAIEIPDWNAFEALRGRLVESGFELTATQHRLVSPQGVVVDLVPFGALEGEGASIAWPPTGETVMSVLGFHEACEHAEQVRIAEEPELVVPVATPAGMALLKLIAWLDRARDLRAKDALDLAYLLASYEKIPAVRDTLYDSEWSAVMDGYDWDLTRGAAHKLGHDAAAIVGENTRIEIERLARGQLDGRTFDRLIAEMGNQYEKNANLLSAFLAGFGIEG